MISCVCHTQDINATYILVCNTFAVLASRKPNAGASELMMQIVHWLPALHAYHLQTLKRKKMEVRKMPPSGQTGVAGGLPKTISGLPDDGEILAELDEAETKLISVLVYMHVLVATPTQGLQIRNE